jgi:glutamate dehydrogenase/leucine dehydrogenase
VQDEKHLFWDENDVNAKLEKIMVRSFNDVLKIQIERKVNMRSRPTCWASAAALPAIKCWCLSWPRR